MALANGTRLVGATVRADGGPRHHRCAVRGRLGGRGEVNRRDTKLDRDVAVKVLPAPSRCGIAWASVKTGLYRHGQGRAGRNLWRRPEHLVDRHDLDRPEVQRADARLDRLQVADNHDDYPIRLHVLLRDALHVGRRHRLDVLHVLREIVVGQMVNERVLEAPGYVAGGLEGARVSERHVVLRARQLFGRHRLENRVQLVEKLLQCFHRFVGLHAGGREERTCAQAHFERRAGAVRVPVHLTQVVVQAGGEGAAEDRVHHGDGEIVRRGSRHANRSDADLRLRRARLVDQIHLPRRGRLDRRQLFCGGRTGRLPSAEALLEERHHLVGRYIADGEQRRVIGTKHRRVEGAQIVGRERLDRFGRPHLQRAVAVTFTVQDARERGRRNGRRIVARLQQAGEPLLALALQLVFRERRTQRHVGHDRQRFGKPRDRHVQTHGGRVGGRRRSKSGAEAIDRVGDLERGPRAGAFLEHCGGQAREAVFARRIVGGAAERDEVHLRNRHFVHLDDPYRQTVRQLLLLNRRKPKRRRWSRLRRMRAVGRLRAGYRGCEENKRERNESSYLFHKLVCGRRPSDRPARAGPKNRPCRYGFGDPLSGSTINSTRLSSGRNCAAAALTSFTEITRYRPRSSLNQSGSPV